MSMKDLSVDFVFYGLLDLTQRSIGLIMLPLYTRVLSQREYGDLDILLLMTSIAMVLVDLQFIPGFSRLYLEYRRDGRGPRFAGTAIAARLIGGVGIAAAIIAAGRLGDLESSFVPSFSGHEAAWMLVACLVPLSLAYDVLLLQTRMLRWKQAFAAGTVTSAVVSCAVSVLLAAVWKWGMTGVVLGLVIGKTAGVATLAWKVRTEVVLRVDREILGPLLRYSLPLVPGWWVGFASSYIGRFFIYGVQGADQNAILAISMKIASIIGMYSVSFRSAWQPLAMGYIGDAAGEAFYVRSLRLFMAGGLLSALCLAALLHPLLLILAPGPYSVVELYFPLFAVGTLLAECEGSLQLGNQISRRTHWISLSALLYLLVNITILVLFTRRLGVVAAGLGLVVAALAKTIATYFSGQRNWRIPYDLGAMAWFGAGCAGFLALGACLSVPSIPAWSVRTGMLLLAVVVPFCMLDHGERRLLGTFAMRWMPTRGHDAVG